MKLSALLFLLALPSSAHAEWSCVAKEGWLMTCDGPATCAEYFPNCVAGKKTPGPECPKKPSCRQAIGKKPAPVKDDTFAVDPRPKSPPPKPAQPPKKPAVLHTEWAEFGPSVDELATKKIAEVKDLVLTVRTRPAPAPKKNASGLTPEEEARLFGAEPAKPDTARPWPEYMSAADHKRIVEELKDQKLRYEIRRRLSATPANAPGEDKETAALLTSLANEAEKKSGEVPKEQEDLKPLNPVDAFGLDPSDVKSIEKGP